MRRLSAPPLVLLSALLQAACGGGDAPAAEATESSSPAPLALVPSESTSATAGAEVLGTLDGTVDGQSMTWYAVSGSVGDGPYSSAVWTGETGERQIAAGGFDTMDPPLDSFEQDAGGMAVSFGSYTGSVMAVFAMEAVVTAPATLTFPAAEGRAGVYFQRQASVDDIITTTFWLTDGTLEVSVLSFAGEVARMQGTFSGTFRTLGTGEEVEVTDGRFDVTGIPSAGTMLGG